MTLMVSASQGPRAVVLGAVAEAFGVALEVITEQTAIPLRCADEIAKKVSLVLKTSVKIAYNGTTTVGDIVSQVDCHR